MWLSLDDTDSVLGGCTTHMLAEFVACLPEGVDVVGWPRLVRLNPNVPHKTRGNGAVAVRLGHGQGRPGWVGQSDGRDLHAYHRGGPLGPREARDAVDRLRRLVAATARLDDPRTQPGMVASSSLLDPALYHAMVHRYVGAGEARGALDRVCASSWAWNGGRGVRGAAAALAWPGTTGTFEAVAYRDPALWGKPRRVDGDLGPRLDAEHPATFDNWDADRGHLRIVPASPCPVLAGVRGTDADDVRRAVERVGPEAPRRVLLFATNQGTDDHVRPVRVAAVRPMSGVRLDVHVARRPWTLRGGHVFARVADATGILDVAAFEPTGPLRRALSLVRPGDALRVHGGVHADPSLVALEKFEVVGSVARPKPGPPRCAACDRSMKSRGTGAHYRCPSCRRRAPAVPVGGHAGTARAAHEAPVRVRRHLARPLALERLAAFPPG